MYDNTGTNWNRWGSNKGFKEQFGSQGRKTFKDSLQKTAVPGTSHTIRNVLQSETVRLCGGDRRWFRRSARKKRAVTREDEDNKDNNETRTEFDVWQNINLEYCLSGNVSRLMLSSFRK